MERLCERHWDRVERGNTKAEGRARGREGESPSKENDEMKRTKEKRCKHGKPQKEKMKRSRLFSQTEITENHIQQIFDIDAARNAAQCPHGKPHIFGDQFGHITRKRAVE